MKAHLLAGGLADVSELCPDDPQRGKGVKGYADSHSPWCFEYRLFRRANMPTGAILKNGSDRESHEETKRGFAGDFWSLRPVFVGPWQSMTIQCKIQARNQCQLGEERGSDMVLYCHKGNPRICCIYRSHLGKEGTMGINIRRSFLLFSFLFKITWPFQLHPILNAISISSFTDIQSWTTPSELSSDRMSHLLSRTGGPSVSFNNSWFRKWGIIYHYEDMVYPCGPSSFQFESMRGGYRGRNENSPNLTSVNPRWPARDPNIVQLFQICQWGWTRKNRERIRRSAQKLR